MITVINGKKHGFIGKNKIYIGRQNEANNLPRSPLANPYVIGRHGDRTKVIAKYRVWLWKEFQKGKESEVYRELLRVSELAKKADLELTCYCAPASCHGDVIKRCLQWMMNKTKTKGVDYERLARMG